MNKCKFTPYEGTAPYIFISYAHKDSDKVYPILDELESRGYRIWYDDGIAPGSEWPEYIAEHLNNSDVVIAFISPNSIASSNCRREVTFALSRKKKFLAIVLEETEMSLGMEMQLSAHQSIMKYNYATEEAFYKKVCGAPDLVLCKAEKKPEPVATEEVKPEIKAPAVDDSNKNDSNKNAISAEDMKAVEHMEKLVSDPKPEEKKSEKPANKKKILVILAAVVGAIALIFIVNGIVKSATAIRFDNGTKVDSKATSLSVRDITVTQEQLNKIAKMKNLNDIQIRNCEIKGTFPEFKNASNMKYVNLENSPVDNYAFLKNMTGLFSLNLEGGNFGDNDAAMLSGMDDLNTLNLAGNSAFTDISVIPGEKMRTLILDGAGIQSIDPVCDFENLTTLSISFTQVKAIDKPFKSLRLENLEMMGLNEVNNLNAFKDLTQLKVLKVAGCKGTDISWIAESRDSLVTLDISGVQINEETKVAIGTCTNIKELYMNAVPLTDLSFIGQLKELVTLYASNCGLKDVSVLSDVTTLQRLWLNNNGIEVLTTAAPKLGEINAAHNKIKDYSKLLVNGDVTTHIAIYDNPGSLDTICEKGNYSVVIADYDESVLNNEKLKSFSRLFIVGTPANKQVELEDYYSRYETVTKEDLDKWISESGSVNYSNWTNK